MARKNSEWGDKSVFELAMKSRCLSLIEHDVCQEFLDDCWYSFLDKNLTTVKQIITCIFVPVLIPAVIKYQEGGGTFNSEHTTLEEAVQLKQNKYKVLDTVSEEDDSDFQSVESFDSLKSNKLKFSERQIFKQLLLFYTAPITIFYHYVFAQVIHLAVFAYFLLHDLCLPVVAKNLMFIIFRNVS